MLRLSTVNNFAPGVNEQYLLMTYGGRSGLFAFVAPKMPVTVAFSLDFAALPTALWMRTVTRAVRATIVLARDGFERNLDLVLITHVHAAESRAFPVGHS